MPGALVIPDIDRIVFETPTVRLGAFRCPPTHPAFTDSGPIGEACFVFPRTAVVIQHKDERAFASDPTIATLYNRGQEYRRQPVSPVGDRCDWYGICEDALRDALTAYDQRAAADSRRPIRFAFARVDARTYLGQRQLFTRVSRGNCDPLEFEESVLGLLDLVLASAYGDPQAIERTTTRRAADDIACDASALIGRRFAEPLTLADIASGVNASLFHVCRSFRRSTGMTLHAYRNQLRLRTALERLEDGSADLSRLAMDLGYSSHSHFTASFRHVFGVTPSIARLRVSANS
jgi:AraC family transcriptional regulator